MKFINFLALIISYLSSYVKLNLAMSIFMSDTLYCKNWVCSLSALSRTFKIFSFKEQKRFLLFFILNLIPGLAIVAEPLKSPSLDESPINVREWVTESNFNPLCSMLLISVVRQGSKIVFTQYSISKCPSTLQIYSFWY